MRHVARVLTLAGVLAAPVLAQQEASLRIVPGAVGGLRVGMTVAQARVALKGFTFGKGVYSDHKGAMLPVSRGKTTALWLLAGKYDNGELMSDPSRIDLIQVHDGAFGTAEGVHPGMLVTEAEKKLGRVKLLEAVEFDGVEIATFANQPAGLKYGVKVPGGGDAGKYAQPAGEYRKATSYQPTAIIDMILVAAAPPPPAAPTTLTLAARESRRPAASGKCALYIKYPEVTGGASAAVRAQMNAALKNALPPGGSAYAGDTQQSTFTTEYTVRLNRPGLLSVSIQGLETNREAAHPSKYVKTLTFDTATGRLYALGDLFATPAYREKLNALICARLAADPQLSEGGQRKPADFTADVAAQRYTFYLSKQGLHIVRIYDAFVAFDVQVTIPFAELKSIAKAGGPLASK